MKGNATMTTRRAWLTEHESFAASELGSATIVVHEDGDTSPHYRLQVVTPAGKVATLNSSYDLRVVEEAARSLALASGQP